MGRKKKPRDAILGQDLMVHSLKKTTSVKIPREGEHHTPATLSPVILKGEDARRMTAVISIITEPNNVVLVTRSVFTFGPCQPAWETLKY